MGKVPRKLKIAEVQRLIEEGLESGVSTHTVKEVLAEARRRAGLPVDNGV